MAKPDEPTIPVVRNMKERVSREIADLLQSFTRQTTIGVKNIRLYTIQTVAGNDDYHIELELEL